MCAWDTTESDVDSFVEAVRAALLPTGGPARVTVRLVAVDLVVVRVVVVVAVALVERVAAVNAMPQRSGAAAVQSYCSEAMNP